MCGYTTGSIEFSKILYRKQFKFYFSILYEIMSLLKPFLQNIMKIYAMNFFTMENLVIENKDNQWIERKCEWT